MKLANKTCLLIFLFVLLYTHFKGQPFENKQPNFINGYSNRISGETLPYFSIYRKYAKEALLTRCTDGNKTIEWETDAIPDSIQGDYAWFTWIAAHSSGTSSGTRNFDLYINDEFTLTFSTKSKAYQDWWSFAGIDSALFAFEFKTKDGANDSHGMAYLRVPLHKYKKGSSLRLKIIGHKQNSNDWFMTFRFAFTEKIEITPQPFLLKDKKHQLLNITVLHFGQTATLHLKIDDKVNLEMIIKNGFNSFDIPVETVTKPTEIKIAANIANHISINEKKILQPVKFREIHLIHHAHTDIGYSHVQEEVIRIHNDNIRKALYMIDKTKNYPIESRFVWNIESAWVVENFLSEASEHEKQALFIGLRKKQIVLSGLYANILTGLCMPEEIDWISDYSVNLGMEKNFPVNTAMFTDIPGISWSVVASLAKKGIRYFSDGINYIQGMPGNGDRIGHALDSLGDKPFWWKSPSGKDSILMFCGAKGYSSWHGTGMGAVFELGPEKISNYLKELDAKNYPYQLVHWRYNIVADNGPIDTTISDFVKQWNEYYASPKLMLANVQDFFLKFENLYGNSIPTYKGDFTPYWEDGAYSTAKEETANRMAAQKIIALEKLTANKKLNMDKSLFYKAKKYVLLFHEHTWGAHNSISEPDIGFVNHQWNYKKSFVDSALLYTNLLEQDVLSKIPKKENQLIVINTLPFSRSGFVEFSYQNSKEQISLKDESGRFFPVQSLSNGKFGFIASVIPANGEKKFTITSGNVSSKISWPFSLTLDNKTGAISNFFAFDKEWVNTNSFKGLTQALYINGLNPNYFEQATLLESKWTDSGEVVKTLQLKCAMPGVNDLVYHISQYNGIGQLKIHIMFDKKEIRTKESIHIAFPMQLENAVTRIGVGDGVITPEKLQIPGSNKEFYSVQKWINMANEFYNVTISSPQGALFEIGEMINEEKTINGYKPWKEKGYSSPDIFLYAMNNYWHTNFKAGQDGKTEFDIYIQPVKGKFDKEKSNRFGSECTEPLIVVGAR